MPVTPYVVGQWVRGERFYGHRQLIEEILDGNRDCVWLLGTRRIGKTSILKELERLTSTVSGSTYFPLFWDFQGSEEARDLAEGFSDAQLDATERLEALGIALEDLEGRDLFDSINRTRRALKLHGKKLLLLGDEAEELVSIHQREPHFLSRLRRALQSSEGIRTVLASTVRLWKLVEQDSSTSPFLHGFTPALPVRRLADDEARALIRQDRLPEAARPHLDDETVEAIRSRCDNHPYLLQLLGERLLELGDLDRAIEEIATDQMVGFFFDSDLAMLDGSERAMLQALAERQDGATPEELQATLSLGASAAQGLHRLEVLGLVDRSADNEYSLVNEFFRRWLVGREDEPDPTEQLSLSNGPPASRPHLLDARYELLERVGSGSAGEVYKARDSLLDTLIAVKLLHRDHSLDAATLERLRREVVLSRDLSHPNLLTIYHLGEEDGQHYVTMQFVEGTDLAEVISREAPMPAERVLGLAVKLASALAAVHHRDVLHRDIKPSNILVDSEGEPLISDFGLARLPWSPGVTRNGWFVGTPAYASPEQARTDPLDARSDLYSLGAVLFEMATGRCPFVAHTHLDLLDKQAHTPPPAPKDVVSTVPEDLSSLILQCLAKAPEDRCQTAAELGEALVALLVKQENARA